MKQFFKNTYLAFIFLLLYAPITVLILFSFNSIDSVRNFGHFSIDPYKDLMKQGGLWTSLSVTLIVAVVSTVVSTIIGTFAALGLSKSKKLTRNMTLGITNIPLINADVVTAVSLMLVFMALGFSFGIWSLILAHISFNVPYVIITVLPRLRSLDPAQLEASQDLGATPWYTLRKVVLPTIKPAIISGAAIAFAMSFDDFVISYFTGGSTANVSTYIYSLKRLKPFINAFSTLVIALIALIIITWNIYMLTKNRIVNRNKMIMQGNYNDKKLMKLEKSLLRMYMQLNSYTNIVSKKPKKRKRGEIYDIQSEIDIEKIQVNLEKNAKLVSGIQKLEDKLNQEYEWINDVKMTIVNKRKAKEQKSKELRDKYIILRWKWKTILVSIVTLGSFTGLGVAYYLSNIYDLSVANWGNYISPEILKGFENEYHVKVKYDTFSDNESLYSKLFTTSYDLMVPSDYMVAQLATEGRLEKLDQTKLSAEITTPGNLDAALVEQMKSVTFTAPDDGPHENLLDYSVPYFWGDNVIVVNTVKNPHLLQDLGYTSAQIPTDPEDYAHYQIGWEILQKAAANNKTLALSDDMHNLFMTALTTLHFQNQFAGSKYENTGTGTFNQIGNTFTDYVNAQSNKQIDDSYDWLKPVIKSSKTTLLNDDIVDTVADSSKFDIAVMYNGDLLSALQQAGDNFPKYTILRPYSGTNLWNDDMVISKGSPHSDLAYKFMNYIMSKDVQINLSSEFSYTSPLKSAIDEVSQLHDDQPIWKHSYVPLDGQEENIIAGGTASSSYNGLYNRDFDKYMQSQYNRLIAR